MKIEVGKRYLYKRNVVTNGESKSIEEVVTVKKICEHRAKVRILGGRETTVDIRFLHDFEAYFPNVESQTEPPKPAHYDTGIDTIAFMRANCPPEQVEGFLRGNALKYLQRYPSKGMPVEDLKKARHYIEMLIEEVEGR